MRQISEVVSFENNEIRRDVAVSLVLPDGDLSSTEVVDGIVMIDENGDPVVVGVHGGVAEDDDLTYFVPLLHEPEKGELVDISQVSTRDGRDIDVLSHHEHIEASILMVLSRFLQTISAPVELGDLDAVVSIGDNLADLVSMGAEDASERFSKLFDLRSHQLRGLDGPVRPADEIRLYNLCKMLATRYPLLARVNAVPGEPLEIRYLLREVPTDTTTKGYFRPLRERFGSIPSSLAIPIPLARRSADYRVRIQCPSGLYIYSLGLERPQRGVGFAPVDLSGLYEERRTDGPSLTTRPSGASSRLAHIHRGGQVKHPLRLALRVFEVPPGATLVAWVIALMSLAVCTSVAVLVKWGDLSLNADSAALVVALVGALPAFTGPFLPRTDMFDSPLLARVALFATGAASTGMAVWVLAMSHGRHVDENLESALEMFLRWAPLLAVGVQIAAVATTSWRLKNSRQAYQSVVRTPSS